MSQFKKFQDKFQSEIKAFSSDMDSFPWENTQAYTYWLAQTYYFVRHSTRLLSLAASKFRLENESAHLRFIAHLAEEKSHEKLALKDLELLKVDVSKVPELPATSALYQSQYYWLHQISGVSFMGYIFALEGIADCKGKDVFSRVSAAHGSKAAIFVKVHANEDEDHLIKAFKQLEGLSDEELIDIEKNFELSCALYREMLSEILQQTESTKRKAS